MRREAIIARIRRNYSLPDYDLPGIEQIVDELISEYWNDNEIYKYCCCIEDVNPLENKAKSLYLEWDVNSMNVFKEIEKHWKNLIAKPLNLQFMDRKIWVELDKHREFSVYPAIVKTVSIGRLNEVVGWRLDHDEKMICKHNNYFYTVKNLIVECQKVINERFWSIQ